MCKKGNDDECEVHEKISDNNRQRNYEHEKECDEIAEKNKGVIGVFVNNELRITDENYNF